MKIKYIALLTTILMIMSCIAFISAEEKTITYELNEIGVTLSLPSNYLAVTRYMKRDDPILDKIGLDRDSLVSYMVRDQVYLYAVNRVKLPKLERIKVRVTDNVLTNDFNTLGYTMLTSWVIPTMINIPDSPELDISNLSIYHHDQTKFIKMYVRLKDLKALQYVTEYNNKLIAIKIETNDMIISSTNEKTLENIINSVNFHSEPQHFMQEKETTDAFIYTDSETITSFIVPSNWSKTPLDKERKTIDVKFESNIDDGLVIMYGCTDIWLEIANAKRASSSRLDIDNDFLAMPILHPNLEYQNHK